jgi:hypothetical protein
MHSRYGAFDVSSKVGGAPAAYAYPMGGHVDYAIMALGAVAFLAGTALFFNLLGVGDWYMRRQDHLRTVFRGGSSNDPMRSMETKTKWTRMDDARWGGRYMRFRMGFIALAGLVFFVEQLAKVF